MIYHLVVGDEAAKPLQQAIDSCVEMEGSIVVLRDLLHLGPLKKAEGQSFNSLRSEWWQKVNGDGKSSVEVNDLQELLSVGNKLNQNSSAKIWFWMAPWPADLCAYYWALDYLRKYVGRISLVNLAHLPFLDDDGKIFYPKNISEILAKELVKARKLARAITPSEIELATDFYEDLIVANAGIRGLQGEKKLVSHALDFYDATLVSLLSGNFQKASKILALAVGKSGVPTGDAFLAWRLKELALNGQIESRGETSKTFKEWEVRLAEKEENEALGTQNLPLSNAV